MALTLQTLFAKTSLKAVLMPAEMATWSFLLFRGICRWHGITIPQGNPGRDCDSFCSLSPLLTLFRDRHNLMKFMKICLLWVFRSSYYHKLIYENGHLHILQTFSTFVLQVPSVHSTDKNKFLLLLLTQKSQHTYRRVSWIVSNLWHNQRNSELIPMLQNYYYWCLCTSQKWHCLTFICPSVHKNQNFINNWTNLIWKLLREIIYAPPHYGYTLK